MHGQGNAEISLRWFQILLRVSMVTSSWLPALGTGLGPAGPCHRGAQRGDRQGGRGIPRPEQGDRAPTAGTCTDCEAQELRA